MEVALLISGGIYVRASFSTSPPSLDNSQDAVPDQNLGKCESRDVIQDPLPLLHAVHPKRKNGIFFLLSKKFLLIILNSTYHFFVNYLRYHKINRLVTLA